MDHAPRPWLLTLAFAGACHPSPAPSGPLDARRCLHAVVDTPAPEPVLREAAAQLRLSGSTLHTSPDDGRAFTLSVIALPGAPDVIVQLTAVAPQPSSAACDADAALVIDEEAHPLGVRPTWEPASDGASAEELRATLPVALLEEAARARCVRFEVCGASLPLHPRQIEALLQLTSRLGARR